MTLRRGSSRGPAWVVAGLCLWPAMARAHDGCTPVDGPQDFALVDMDRFPTEGLLAVQRGRIVGSGRFILRPNVRYRLVKMDRRTLRVGMVEFRSGRDGARFKVPHVCLRPSSGAHDRDGDGLSDLGEFVVGTDPDDPDSDDDGITDAAAVQAGTLDQPLLRTGLIASVQLPGQAQDVCAVDELAAVALGPAGVALTNVYTRLAPEVIGLIDTPGEARRVACSGALLAVADGAGGLSVIDVADPPAVRVAHRVPATTLGGNALSVAAFAGIALVGLSTGDLVSVDLASGAVLERVRLGARPVVDVVVSGDAIHALDTHSVHALALTLGRLTVTSSVASPFVAGPNARVFSGGGVVYAVHGKGTNTFDAADPLRPTLIRATNTTQFGWKHLVVDGAGLALAAVSPNQAFDGPHEVELYDARDPAQTTAFLARFETPGVARAVALFNGLCYVADHDRGLQVVNYRPQDRAGIPPTISLSTNQPDPARCEEGALLRVTAACADDVAVRNCELYVDGVKRSTDGNFPFDFYLIAPRRAQRERITVVGRVSDTGGRVTFSDPLVIELTPDSVPPEVARVVPADGGLTSRAVVVAAFFDEPVDPATVSASTFRVTWSGADREFETEDDAPVSGAVQYREDALGAFFTPALELPPGRHRAELTSGVADAAGNALAPVAWTFEVYGAGGPDQDGDLLPDAVEALLGLDPTRADTDGDGTPDGQEDADSDGVPNLFEVALETDLRSPDSDADGVLDRDEDQDADLLADWHELLVGTDLFHHDSDGDTFTDKDEVGTPPAAPVSNALDPASTPLRSLVAAVSVNDVASPVRTLGRELIAITARNAASPERTLGRALAQASAQNRAAPEAVAGQTQSLPTSVRNGN